MARRNFRAKRPHQAHNRPPNNLKKCRCVKGNRSTTYQRSTNIIPRNNQRPTNDPPTSFHATPTKSQLFNRNMSIVPHLPLQTDTRRRSILNPFLSVEAATHWQKSAASPASNNIQSWVKEKSTSTIFLKDAGLMLSDANSSEVDQIVALAAVMRALIQPKPQGIKASELFNTRLIPTISQIATDKLYKSTLHVCTQCNEPNCSGASSARRHAFCSVILCLRDS